MSIDAVIREVAESAILDDESVSDAVRRQASWLIVHAHQIEQGEIDGAQAAGDLRQAAEAILFIARALEAN